MLFEKTLGEWFDTKVIPHWYVAVKLLASHSFWDDYILTRCKLLGFFHWFNMSCNPIFKL